MIKTNEEFIKAITDICQYVGELQGNIMAKELLLTHYRKQVK